VESRLGAGTSFFVVLPRELVRSSQASISLKT
jgi:hypothetical protein